MVSAWKQAAAGVAAAIGVTATMDASGLSAFSSLPLLPLGGLFWLLQRFPRREVGFAWGRGRDYALAVLYPLIVLGTVTVIAALSGALHPAGADWRKAGLNLLLVGGSTVLVVIVTEEGFFRGWLWAALRRAGAGRGAVLVWTSIAFSLWHLSAVVLPTGFNPPPAQVPVFMLNAAVLGVIWGMLRMRSGSLIVCSVSHGLWNGLDYVLYGFGSRVGALGVRETGFYGPEVGVLGLLLNVLFALALWRWGLGRVAPEAGPRA
jgi:membrane protease YdiL (CAAX protease family)